MLLPQLCHLMPDGGKIFLPIYFFTLIASYKFGLKVGILTAVLSPLCNHLLFGMPPAGMLPVLLVKSTLLALVGAIVADRSQRVSLLHVAAVVVAFPLMYRSARGAFESLDPNMLDAARTLGWSNGRIFLRLMLPLAWSSIASGTVLAFARALGEFGCTLFLAGNQLGSTRTIPIAIYFEWMNGNTEATWFWTIVLLVFSFLVILFINLWSRHTTRYRQKSSHEGRSPKPRRNGTRGGGRRRSAKGLREDSAGSADVLGEGVA